MRTVILLTAMLLGASPAVAQLDQILAYDASRPLDVKTIGTERKSGVRIDDVTFVSVAGGDPAQAYVVRPESGSGPFAGVLFVHWYAPKHPWLAEQLGLP
jgi:hypothetical protein